MSHDMRHIWLPLGVLVLLALSVVVAGLVFGGGSSKAKQPVHLTDPWCIEQGTRHDFTTEEFRRYVELCRS